MGKKLLLSRANIRKAKGQTVAIIVLVLLASVMMNLWLMLGTDYKQNFDRCHDRLNDGHITIFAYRNDEEFLSFTDNLLKNRADVSEYCVTDVYGNPGALDYNGGKINFNLIFIDKDTALSRSVGRVEITEDSDLTSGIYLPVLYKTNYSIGDEIDIDISGKTLNYTVASFINSAMVGSHNCALAAMALTEDKFAELSLGDEGMVREASLISIRLTDKSECEATEAELKNLILEEFPGTIMVSNSYALVSTSRYISQSICAAVLSVMAFLITIIAVVVISSNVMNYIHEDMKNLGALKAIGYKSGQLISALILQFSLVAFITAVIGIALSYVIFPALNDMMISQTGIPYTVRFLPIPCAVTIVAMAGVVAMAVWFSSRRIRKIQPITALRQGVQTHSFKKNYFPLDKTKATLNLALALKNVLSETKRNITIIVTMLVLSLVIVFSGVMLENVVVDKQNFLNMIVGETTDSCINVSPSAEEQLITALENDSRTESFYLYTSNYVTHEDTSLMITASDDFSKVNNQSVIIEGRFPKFDNEIAIAVKYAGENGLEVGQEINVSAGANEEKYIISGFTQITNNLGKDCLMTRGGFERISDLTNVSYYINLKEGTDIDSFNKEITEPFLKDVNTTVNMVDLIDAASQVYISLATVIVTVILVLSAVVVTFVLYLLVRTALNNKRHDFGILKALGFTTKQLILQTALFFMPPVIISTAFGITVSTLVINPLMAIFFSGIGVVKCTFTIPLYFNIIAGIGLVLFAFGAVCLMSVRVRRISAKQLIAE